MDRPGGHVGAKRELESARRRIADVIADIDGVNGAAQSRAVAEASIQLGRVARELGAMEQASTLRTLGYEYRRSVLPTDHPAVQEARMNLAATLGPLGRFEPASELVEEFLSIGARTLPDDDPRLNQARTNLANLLFLRGDLHGARALEEQSLEHLEKVLPETDRNLLAARQNHSLTIWALGDFVAARELQEEILEAALRALPEEHDDVQGARLLLAGTLHTLGEYEAALELMEKVVEIRSRTLPDEHHSLGTARQNLAATLKALGRGDEARVIEERVLEIYERTLRDVDPDFQTACVNLAGTMVAQGELEGALSLYERVRDIRSRTLPEDHPLRQRSLWNLIQLKVRLGRWSEVHALAGELARSLRSAVRYGVFRLSPRELEELVRDEEILVSGLLSLSSPLREVKPDPGLVRESFRVVESLRAVGLLQSELGRQAGPAAEDEAGRRKEKQLTAYLAHLARGGAERSRITSVRTELDRLRRETSRRLESIPGIDELLTEPTPDELAKRIEDGTALVGYRRYTFGAVEEAGRSRIDPERDLLLAHVVLPDGILRRVELGRAAVIANEIERWREVLAVSSTGRGISVPGSALEHGAPDGERAVGARLRELLLDPVLAVVGDAKRLVIALDGVIHAVPLDALPWEDGRVGDRWTLLIRSSFRELLWDRQGGEVANALVAMGGVDYDRAPRVAQRSSEWRARSASEGVLPDLLRGSPFESGFMHLPGTTKEVDGIEAVFTSAFGKDASRRILKGTDATRDALAAAAPEAGALHLATHGWFAPSSIPLREDSRLVDEQIDSVFTIGSREQVRGTLPMLLCGLALAGANRERDVVGRLAGVITAEEIAALDLSRCRLAVVSACDTSVGVRQAGQGVASFQKALQMAGARTVVTSLWSVPDDATRALMIDFYRRLWLDGSAPHEALWQAKKRLRDARDSSGKPVHSPREWAGWVLSGDPD